MQSASGMCDLPHTENIIRRVNAKGAHLRKGQVDSIKFIEANPTQQRYISILPTGYGKSITTVLAYEVLRAMNRVDRVLYVVPTDTQREQYITDMMDDCRALGVDITGVEKADGSARNIRKRNKNLAEVFVTTAQFIIHNTDHFADLLEKGRWLVVADEFQKLSQEGEWGKSVSNLDYAVLLGVTATPIRTDGVPTILGSIGRYIEVTLEQAYQEQAIRGVRAHLEHYFIDTIDQTTREVSRQTTEELRNVSDWEGYKKRRDLRELNKYVSSILGSAYECWLAKSARHLEQHRILVFAMSVMHARQVCETLNILYGVTGGDFAVWIGVGPNGKTDNENRAAIASFKAGKVPCLVQVDKAGEGFNCKQASVLVFLNILGKNTVKARQYMGRGLRRNQAIVNFNDDVCDVFVSPDTDLADLAVEYANRTVGPIEPDKEDDGGPGRADREDEIYMPPDPLPWESFVKNAEFDRSEVVANIPDEEVHQIRARLEKQNRHATDDEIREVIFQLKREQMEQVTAAQNTPEKWRHRVDLLVGSAASLAVRLTNRGVFQPSVIGDAKRAINTKWIELTGRKTDEMLESEFESKYEWVAELIKKMKADREAPLWLRL